MRRATLAFYLRDKAKTFFSYFADRENTTPPNSNTVFFLQVYLSRRHTDEIHRKFFRTWLDAGRRLESLGYSQKEVFAAL